MNTLGGYSARDIARVQAAIVGHSTGYWYFRKSIDDIAKQPDAWRKVYPELVKLMGLAPGADPIQALGVPKVFR